MPLALPLIELSALVIALVCIALALLIVEIMRQVGDLVRPIWLVGGTIADGVEALARGISYVLGKAESGIDAAIGASWHALAWFAREWWHEITAQALGALHIAELVAKLAYAHSGLRALVHRADTLVHGIDHRVRDLVREWRGIEHRVGRLEHDITRGIGHDLRIGLRDVERELHGVERTVTTTIPRAIDYAEGKTTALGRFIGAIPGTSYLDWAKGIAVAGLAALGLNWLRCENTNTAGNRLCGLDSGLLDALLLGTLAVEGSVSLVGMAHELIDLAGDIVPAVTGVVSEFAGVQQRTPAEQGFA